MGNTKVQVKFRVDSGIASGFKARCDAEGVTMSSVISRLMGTCRQVRSPDIKSGNRSRRGKAVADITALLCGILHEEEACADAIPVSSG